MSSPSFPLIAAPFTPFDAAGAVQYPVIARQAEKLLGDGVSGAFICGTTGEGMSLSLEERQSIAEAWREAAGGTSLRVIVHVGHTALPDAKKLAAHANKIGCDGIASIGPVFFEPTSPDALGSMLGEIAALTPLPFYYYHMPSMTRVPYRASELIRPLTKIPTFAGIKFTHNDVDDFALCVRRSEGAFQMLFGRDELLLEGLKAGAHGAVGSTYNYAMPIYQRLLAAFQDGNEAEAGIQQAKASGFIDIFLKYGGVEAGKALMTMCGIDCGPMRLPLEGLTPEAFDRLQTEMESVGFFQDVFTAV